MGDWDRRMLDHQRWYRRRLAALRKVTRAPHGRDELRALRKAAASPRPRTSPRRPAVALGALFVAALVVLYLADRAAGHPLEVIR